MPLKTLSVPPVSLTSKASYAQKVSGACSSQEWKECSRPTTLLLPPENRYMPSIPEQSMDSMSVELAPSKPLLIRDSLNHSALFAMDHCLYPTTNAQMFYQECIKTCSPSVLHQTLCDKIGNVKERPLINELISNHQFFTRRELIKALQNNQIRQVLLLNSGLSPLGIDIATLYPQVKVVEINDDHAITSKKFHFTYGKLSNFSCTTEQWQDVHQLFNYFTPYEPVAIVCEGYLMFNEPFFLDQLLKQHYANKSVVIYDVLNRHDFEDKFHTRALKNALWSHQQADALVTHDLMELNRVLLEDYKAPSFITSDMEIESLRTQATQVFTDHRHSIWNYGVTEYHSSPEKTASMADQHCHSLH